MDGKKVVVDHRLTPEERENFILRVDAEYTAGDKARGYGSEVLTKIFEVGNTGGFQISGNHLSPNFVVLYTSGEVVYWQDKVDKQTGVNYLFVKSGYGAGLTPLLDENGKPLITK